MLGLKLNKYEQFSNNFQTQPQVVEKKKKNSINMISVRVVGRDSETQLQVPVCKIYALRVISFAPF